MSEKNKYFKNVSRLLVYGLLSLSIFFGIAVFIFVLRGQDTQPRNMPDLVGKYYVDVHNDLQRLQLRVNIEKKHFPDQGSGIILYQSLPTGRGVFAREKLTLVVNQPEPILVMPDFTRTALSAAKLGLQKITYEARLYKLGIGAITQIQTDAFPDNTIIDQFPEAGVRISPIQKVYFLVARKKSSRRKTKEIDIKSLVGQNVSIAMASLGKKGLDYRIIETQKTNDPQLDGTVYGVQKDDFIGLKIYYTPSSTKFKNGREMVEVELSEPGRCVGELRHLGSKNSLLSDQTKQIFVTQNHAPDEKVKIFFFRQGRSELSVKCKDEIVYHHIYEPDDLG